MLNRCLLTLLAITLLSTSFATTASAERPEPALRVSIIPAQQMLSRVRLASQWMGKEEMGQLAALMAAPYLNGVDRTQPIGAVLMFEGEDYIPLVFAPVTDPKPMIAIAKEQLELEIEELEGGILKVEGDAIDVFLKQQGGWMFASHEAEHLENLPEDPAATWLGDLPTQYDVVVQWNHGQMPEVWREHAFEYWELMSDPLPEQMEFEDDQQYRARRELREIEVQSTRELVDSLDLMQAGIKIDEESKSCLLDFQMSAVPGNPIHEDFELNREVATEFAGFRDEEAPLSLTMTRQLTDHEARRQIRQMELGRQWWGGLVEAALLFDTIGWMKPGIDDAMDILVEQLESRKLDYALLTEMPDQKPTLLTAMSLPDAKRLEDTLRKLTDFLATQEDNPLREVQWNADQHQGVVLHSAKLDLPENAVGARRLFPEGVHVMLGIGDINAYFAIGNRPRGMIQEAVDRNLATGSQLVPPIHMSAHLTPWVEFVGTMDIKQEDGEIAEQPAAVLKSLEGVSDFMKMDVEPIENGASYRLRIDQWMFKLIGNSF